jgi:hypothetical protein
LGEPQKQPLAKTLGQLWGILALAFLFGMGGYRLTAKGIRLFEPEMSYYLTYGVLLIFGAAKGEFLFRRKFVPRTLARARDALNSSLDLILAPICMLSFYRPWSVKHAVLSWLIVPIMVGLAILFARQEPIPDGPFKGGVDIAIGLALAFTAAIFVVYWFRLLGWWLAGSKAESMPLPSREQIS